MTEKELLELAKTFVQPSVILIIMGGIVSLCTSYWPGFREKYAAMQPVEKSLGQLIIISIVIFVVALLSWTGILAIVPATTFGALTLVVSWIGALILNQTAYSMSKSSPVESVRLIKENVKKKLADAKVEVKS